MSPVTRLLPWLLITLALAGDGDRDARGWHTGTPAANTAQVLSPLEGAELELPKAFAKKVKRTTFFYYFSPTCGHCQATIPEVVRLSAELSERIDFIGVAAARSTPEQIEAFRRAFEVPFPLMHDADRDFARAIGAQSTPTVLVVEPGEGGAVQGRLGFYPWGEGMSLELKLRLWPEEGFAHLKPGVYQGPRACGACHTSELMSWSLSHHAVAYYTLYTRERADDPECVGCHVTGMGEPTGFELGDHDSLLTGVGCEACHSAGGPHDGQAVDAREACVGCHDAEHSIAFSLEKGLPHIDHYFADQLTPEEQEARWSALASGQAERPLLAFPEGQNQGAQACVSCHAEVVQAWSASPHAHAMEGLKPRFREDVACVACHATPTAPKALGQTLALEDYRVDEGVGCESCHGPGEQHVASPTKANILGLGESCPECVIEEVCTSCHTPKWDEGWEIKARLEAARGHGPAAPAPAEDPPAE
ncbi:MAG: redoxin family protein [Alphaproteobacteria bacterium]|nr:redoxin family protein [Alphaproteobacteria bacterium]